MKTILAAALSSLTAVAVSAPNQISVTAEWHGAGLAEYALTKLLPIPFEILKDQRSEPIHVTLRSGNRAVIEFIREYRYPLELSFEKPSGAPAIKSFETQNAGLTLEITTRREGNLIFFEGRGSLNRFAGHDISDNATPADQPFVTSTTFVTRECKFTGRAPLDKPVKMNIGEKGIDAGELTIVFSDVP